MRAGSTHLHPVFGPSGGAQPYGIPYGVVDASHGKGSWISTIHTRATPGLTLRPDTTIEGGSDRHALMVHAEECVLYELYDAHWNGGDPWAGSRAVLLRGRVGGRLGQPRARLAEVHPGTAFEAVRAGLMKMDPDSGQVKPEYVGT